MRSRYIYEYDDKILSFEHLVTILQNKGFSDASSLEENMLDKSDWWENIGNKTIITTKSVKNIEGLNFVGWKEKHERGKKNV